MGTVGGNGLIKKIHRCNWMLYFLIQIYFHNVPALVKNKKILKYSKHCPIWMRYWLCDHKIYFDHLDLIKGMPKLTLFIQKVPIKHSSLSLIFNLLNFFAMHAASRDVSSCIFAVFVVQAYYWLTRAPTCSLQIGWDMAAYTRNWPISREIVSASISSSHTFVWDTNDILCLVYQISVGIK